MADCILECYYGALGCFVGLLKMPCLLAPSIMKKKCPPPYKAAPTLGASAIGDGFKDTFLTSKDGTKLHAVEDSCSLRKPQCQPLVFVHGFPELWISYEHQLKYFMNLGHPVLAVNYRSAGLSDKHTKLENCDIMEGYVEDVRASIAYLTSACGGKKPVLVAHDWGAGLGWLLVGHGLTRGQEIAGYVALSVPPLEAFIRSMTTNVSQLYGSAYMVFFNASILPEVLWGTNNAYMTGLLVNDTDKAVLDPDLINMYRTNILQPGALTGQLNIYRVFLRKSLRSLLPGNGAQERLGYWRQLFLNAYVTTDHPNILGPRNKVDLPVVIVWGNKDIALKRVIFQNLADYLTNYDFIELDGASHWIAHDAPNEVNNAISTLLKKL